MKKLYKPHPEELLFFSTERNDFSFIKMVPFFTGIIFNAKMLSNPRFMVYAIFGII